MSRAELLYLFNYQLINYDTKVAKKSETTKLFKRY